MPLVSSFYTPFYILENIRKHLGKTPGYLKFSGSSEKTSDVKSIKYLKKP